MLMVLPAGQSCILSSIALSNKSLRDVNQKACLTLGIQQELLNCGSSLKQSLSHAKSAVIALSAWHCSTVGWATVTCADQPGHGFYLHWALYSMA